jgi:hypothetical protein
VYEQGAAGESLVGTCPAYIVSGNILWSGYTFPPYTYADFIAITNLHSEGNAHFG